MSETIASAMSSEYLQRTYCVSKIYREVNRRKGDKAFSNGQREAAQRYWDEEAKHVQRISVINAELIGRGE